MPMFIRPTFAIYKQLSLTVTPLPMVKNVHVVQKTIIISEHINNTENSFVRLLVLFLHFAIKK